MIIKIHNTYLFGYSFISIDFKSFFSYLLTDNCLNAVFNTVLLQKYDTFTTWKIRNITS